MWTAGPLRLRSGFLHGKSSAGAIDLTTFGGPSRSESSAPEKRPLLDAKHLTMLVLVASQSFATMGFSLDSSWPLCFGSKHACRHRFALALGYLRRAFSARGLVVSGC